LYPATMLKVFMMSRSFFIEFFGSLRYRTMLSANRNILSFFTDLYYFYFFLPYCSG
jgi:hypothetical protein